MKKLKEVVAIILIVMTLMSASVISANAASATYYKKQKNSYDVYSITTSNAKGQSKKVNTPGFKKTKYTSGSFSVSKSQSVTFTASSKISADYSYGFAKVGAEVSVGYSATKTVAAGTTLNVSKDAPNGIYYLYVVTPRKKVDFKVQKCSLDHTDWYTKYTKTLKTAPMLKNEYLELRREE